MKSRRHFDVLCLEIAVARTFSINYNWFADIYQMTWRFVNCDVCEILRMGILDEYLECNRNYNNHIQILKTFVRFHTRLLWMFEYKNL